MKKLLFILAVIVLGFTATSAKAEERTDNLETICAMKEKAFRQRCHGEMDKAEQTLLQAISIFSIQSEDIQSEYHLLEADLYYTLARYYSLNDKTNESVRALRKAVKLGWNNYDFLAMDNELVKIRKTKAFKSIMNELRTNSTQFAENI